MAGQVSRRGFCLILPLVVGLCVQTVEVANATLLEVTLSCDGSSLNPASLHVVFLADMTLYLRMEVLSDYLWSSHVSVMEEIEACDRL